jgi:hypothetical protein
VVTAAGALGHQEGALPGSSVADVEHSFACQEGTGVLPEVVFHPGSGSHCPPDGGMELEWADGTLQDLGC